MLIELLIGLLVVTVLVLLNALFVAAEFATLGARASRLRSYAEAGNRSARLLLPYVTDVRQLDRYISSCQLGITTTSLCLGAYGEHALAGQLAPLLGSWAAHGLAVVIVLLVLSTMQVVLGEQVPKSFALHRPDKVAMITAWPVVVWKACLRPVISFLNGSARAVLWMIRAPAAMHRHVHSRQEIDLIIEQSRDKGAIESDQHDRLQHVLDLEIVTARQLMIPRPDIVALDIEAHVDDGVQIIIDGDHTRLPVYRGSIDDVVGVIHTKDLAREAVEKGSIKDWRKLIRPIFFVNEGMTADRLIATMREKKTLQAVVMDEFGGVAGLVTLEDVLTHIFGEVGDEFSPMDHHPERLPDGFYRLPGRMRLDEVSEWLGTSWTGSSTTLGGFVIERVGHLPSPGESVEVDGIELRVDKIENRVVTSVLLRPPTVDVPDGKPSAGRSADGKAGDGDG